MNIKWQCRRGMLELDLKFNAFLDKHFNKLTDKEVITFKKILNYPDQTLYGYLFSNQEYPHEFKYILQLIKSS